jgi:PKD repeat protein
VGKHPITGLTIVVVAAGAVLVAAASPALADASTPLYVNNATGANCSDSGTGTQTQPYCTISAAVAAVLPGQTIDVADGTYGEHVTIAKSGTAGHPITLHGQGAGRSRLSGTNAGFTIDGQHDVVITGFVMSGTLNAPGIAVSNSTRISLQLVGAQTAASDTPVVGIQLSAVTDSSLVNVYATGAPTTGIALDAATTRVLLKSVTATASNTATSSKAIEVSGSNNTIINSHVFGGSAAGIVIEPGVADSVVANSLVEDAGGDGIYNAGATGTAITNNTVRYNCGTGIRVDGASSGVSVQNNVATDNGTATSARCGAPVAGAVEIGVYDGAANNTVVDYNTVYHSVTASPSLYAWNTPMGLTAFRAASGQAAHDIESPDTIVNVDSANSAAPGFQSTDWYGNPREDDPVVTNTGAGPVTYADRGYIESTTAPTARLALGVDQAAVSLTADASGSTPGWGGPITSYAFDFGDGTTITQSTPVATHHYAQPGTYTVTVTVTDASSLTSTATQQESLWPAVRTIAFLSRSNDRYVTADAAGSQPLIANRAAIGAWEQFDLVEPGSGVVALRSRTNGLYVTAYTITPNGPELLADSVTVNTTQLFQLVTNPDGTVSLLSQASNQYVSSNNGVRPMTADRAVIGPWEEFNPVDVANASISMRAHANGRYVTAENGGSQPLIANRTAVGLWEQFDLVDAGGGYVALYAHANGHFVTAENAGGSALIANRTAIGSWEKFKIIKNADGSVSLLANANGRYVTAEAAGSQPLIANRTAIGAWEEFDRPTG